MLVNGAWIDITAYDMVRDDSGNIPITSGITGGEGSQTERAQAKLTLKNQDARFTRRNPSGPYYGGIGRGTQFRISVPDGNGGKAYRIWGEAASWEDGWNSTGSDVWVDVTVAGIMQRLAQDPAPQHSVIYNAITDPLPSSVVAYWPMEDAADATSLASALTNGSPMTWTGNPTLATYDGFGASDPLPTITGAALTGGVTKYDTTAVTQYQMRFLLAVPAGGFNDTDVIARLKVQEVAAGASLLNYFDIHYNDPPGGIGSFGGRGTLTISAKDGDEASVGSNASTTLDVRGRLLRVSLENSISGGTLTGTLRVLDINTGITDSASMIVTSTSMSRVLSMSLGPSTLGGSAGVSGAAVGHLLLQDTITDINDLGRAIQPLGEAAGRRIQRLCGEQGIPFEWVGDLDDTVAMGAQSKANLLSLTQESCLADGGLLYETKDALGLGYRTRASLYNQAAALTLSYTGFNFNEVPIPVEDDRQIQNNLTVTVGGISATYEETSGPLGTDAIGSYGESSGLTLNLATTDTPTLLDAAAWRVHLGTVDEDRYPTVTVNLAHASITPELKRAILALRMGDRAQFTGMPSWVAPDQPDQLTLGTSETISHFEHKLTFTCAPASPYSYMGVLDDGIARLDTDGSELLSAVTSSDTAIDVVPTDDLTMLWTTDTADMPLNIRVGGEIMTVSAINPKISDTFTRTVANGWGSADTGQAWTTSGGSASDYSTNGTQGLHSATSVNVSRYTVTAAPSADVDLRVEVATSALATGGPQYAHLVARYADVNNNYLARIAFNTDQTVTLVIEKRVAGTQTDLVSLTVPGTHAAGVAFVLRFQVEGAVLRAKCWPLAEVEPGSWQVSVTDSALSAPGSVGVRSILSSANTNVLPVTYAYDNFQLVNVQTMTVTRSVNGVIKAQVAGEAVSLAHPTIISL